MNQNDILNQSKKQEQLRCFNIEKHIIGTESYNINQDILKGLDQDEILEKAKLGYYLNPELEIVKSIWSDSLNKSEDKLELLKSFSSDLKSRFPNGAWRTINGSHVFINNGKVIAGLGGFNQEIDKFFKEKKTSKESKVYKDKNNIEVYDGNVSFNSLSEKDKRLAYNNGIKSGELGGSFEDFKKVFKDEEIYDKLIQPNYNESEDKKEETQSAYDQKKSEPEMLKKDFEEKKKGLDKFKAEDGEFDVDKMLQGDVVENFKQYNEYLNSAKKALGKRHRESYINSFDLENKSAKIDKKPISVKQAKTEEEVLKNIVGNDKNKPVLSGIYHDPSGYKVATDAFKMIAVKTDIGENSGKLINPKTNESIAGQFPKWKTLVDGIKDNYDKTVNAKLSDIHSFSNEAEKLNKEHYATVVELKQIGETFDAEILNSTVKGLRMLGVEDVKLNYRNNVLGIFGKNKKDQEVSAIVMFKLNKGHAFVIKEK